MGPLQEGDLRGELVRDRPNAVAFIPIQDFLQVLIHRFNVYLLAQLFLFLGLEQLGLLGRVPLVLEYGTIPGHWERELIEGVALLLVALLPLMHSCFAPSWHEGRLLRSEVLARGRCRSLCDGFLPILLLFGRHLLLAVRGRQAGRACCLAVPGVLWMLPVGQVQLALLRFLHALLEEALNHLRGLLAAEFAHGRPAANRALGSDLHGLAVSHGVARQGLRHRNADASLDLTLGGDRGVTG